MQEIFGPKVVEHFPLKRALQMLRRIQGQNGWPFRAKLDPLVGGRHVTTCPVFRPTDGAAGFIQHDHVAREILIGTAEAIVHP